MDTYNRPSLLPYLLPNREKLQLEISVKSADSTALEDTKQSPFEIINCSDPFIFLVRAGITSDLPGQRVPLTMVVQRSSYGATSDTSASNSQIEEVWQRTLPKFRENQLSPKSFLLAGQVTETNLLQPFQPLFYCLARQHFFHPPCPHCGAGLDLCTDDNILETQGLAPYSTSLQRYLFCPHCFSNAENLVFYAPKNGNDQQISDEKQLFEEWSRLDPSDLTNAPSPCRSCANATSCYGEVPLAPRWLSSFSFFPFNMLLFNTDHQIRFDFTALLGGADLNDCLNGPPGQPSSEKQEPLPEEKPAAAANDQPPPSNLAIRTILLEIANRWETTREEADVSPSPLHGSADQESPPPDLMETVILRPGSLENKPVADENPDQPQAPLADEHTVIVSTTDSSISSSYDPDETLRIRPVPPKENGQEEEQTDISQKQAVEIDLQETVLLTPKSGYPAHPNQTIPPDLKDAGGSVKNRPLSKAQPAANEDPAETIILPPKKKT